MNLFHSEVWRMEIKNIADYEKNSQKDFNTVNKRLMRATILWT